MLKIEDQKAVVDDLAKREQKRDAWVRLFGFLFVLMVIGIAVAIDSCVDGLLGPEKPRLSVTSPAEIAEQSKLHTVADTVGFNSPGSVQPCGAGSTKSGQTLRGQGSDVVLRAGPNTKYEKLINQKATQVLKSTHYLTIDYSVTVMEECNEGGWSRIGVTEPEWLRESHIGWVPSSSLREQHKDGSGQVAFTEADFDWENNPKLARYKKIVVAGVNKVHRENSRCGRIDTNEVFISSSMGSPSDPAFFVTCGDFPDVFNAYFSKSDVEQDRLLAAAKHIDRDRAIDLCESRARSQTVHPSTFSFSRVMDLAVKEYANGRTSVSSTFTVKNSFNLELEYRISCFLDSTGLIDAVIRPDAS